MAKDFKNLTQEEVSKLSPEEFKQYLTYFQQLDADSKEKDELIKEQAEKIATQDQAISQDKPVISVKLKEGDKTVNYTLRVNFSKFRHLGESGQWESKTIADLKNEKTAPQLVKELLDKKSSAITVLSKK